SGVYRAIDKLDKIGPDGVRTELLQGGLPAESAERLLEHMQLEGSAEGALEQILAGDALGSAAVANLRAICAAAAQMGVSEASYLIAPRLARGLSYYTGAVFETVIEQPPMGSLLGGGRYDELIGLFAGRALPTVGLAFGIERLHDVMEQLGMGPGRSSVA